MKSLGLAVVLSAFSGVALADEAPDTTLTLNEVSVTAIKGAPTIDRMPVASTVVTAPLIESLNIKTIKNMSEVSPNFYVPDYGSRMTSTIYVRGMGARIDQPVVGFNVDNVPFLNKDGYDFDIEDIDRIEVLRGPQSTLYGRNTMGGLVNVYTLSPMKYQGLRSMLEYGTANSFRASVGYYDKLSSRLAMAVTGFYGRSDGYFTNKYNGSDCGKEQQAAARWKTVWYPAANLKIENAASFSWSEQSGYPYENIDRGEINYNDTCFYRRTGVTDGLTVKLNLGNVELSSITSFQYVDDNMTLDQDFLPLSYFTLTQKRHEWALTQDFIGKGTAGAYSWLAGLFGFYKKTRMEAPVTFKKDGIDNLILDNANKGMNPMGMMLSCDDDVIRLGSRFRNPVWGVAVYHQSSYRAGAWEFSAGIRLDVEKNTLKYYSDCETAFTLSRKMGDTWVPVKEDIAVDLKDNDKLSNTFVEALPKVSVTYNIPSLPASNVYMSVARGYKSGGYNTQMFSDVLQQKLMSAMGTPEKYDAEKIMSYKPEYSWNYEVGAHLSLLDGKLRGQAALFYIDCRDQQLTSFPDGLTTGRIMANAGKTRSYGAELSMSYSPVDRWDLNVAYGYTNAKFVKYDDGVENYKGKYIPYSPKNTIFANVKYTQPVKGWVNEVKFDVNCRGAGDIMWNESNTVKQPFYATIGASVTAVHNDCSLTVWGENLTDAQYDTFYFVSIGNAFLQKGKPMRAGVTLRMNF